MRKRSCKHGHAVAAVDDGLDETRDAFGGTSADDEGAAELGPKSPRYGSNK